MFYSKGYKTAKEMRREAKKELIVREFLNDLHFGRCWFTGIPIKGSYTDDERRRIDDFFNQRDKLTSNFQICAVKYNKKKQKYQKHKSSRTSTFNSYVS